jgi:hypothetical protein
MSEQLLREAQPRQLGDRKRVVILAGGAETMSDEAADELEALLHPALERYDSAVLSGGSNVGVPGVAGRFVKGPRPYVVGYIPQGRHADIDTRYEHLRCTEGDDFGVREPLAMWIDILAAGIAPGDVRVLVCPGGAITRSEMLLARALGAPVGRLDFGAVDAPALGDDLPGGHDGIFDLPVDRMTIRAFLRWSSLGDPDLRESIAKGIHGDYRRRHRRRKSTNDPALAPWEHLVPALQQSNLAQADDIPSKLDAVGRRLRQNGSDLKLTTEEISLLAELEHGRWNVERLLAGWRQGERESARLVTPFLKPWAELTEEEKAYDREAVETMAPALRAAGWGVEDLP